MINVNIVINQMKERVLYKGDVEVWIWTREYVCGSNRDHFGLES